MLSSVVDLKAEIPNRAFQLGASEQELNDRLASARMSAIDAYMTFRQLAGKPTLAPIEDSQLEIDRSITAYPGRFDRRRRT